MSFVPAPRNMEKLLSINQPSAGFTFCSIFIRHNKHQFSFFLQINHFLSNTKLKEQVKYQPKQHLSENKLTCTWQYYHKMTSLTHSSHVHRSGNDKKLNNSIFRFN